MSFLILNYVFQCRNQSSSYLSHESLLPSLFLRAKKNLGRNIISTLSPKTLDHNGVFCKVTLRETRGGRPLEHHPLGLSWKLIKKKKNFPTFMILSLRRRNHNHKERNHNPRKEHHNTLKTTRTKMCLFETKENILFFPP